MELMGVIIGGIALIVSIIAVVYSRQANKISHDANQIAREANQIARQSNEDAQETADREHKEGRITKLIQNYRDLYIPRRATGLTALMMCDLSGMTTEDLDEAVTRIRASCDDPLKQVRGPLKEAGISLADFVSYMGERGYTVQDHSPTVVIQEMLQRRSG